MSHRLAPIYGVLILLFFRHPTCCCLCFDVQNAMSVGVNVKTTVAETEEVTLRDGCPRTSEVEIPAKGNLRIGVHFPRCLLSVPELRRREKIEDVYTRAVKDSVTLEWRLSQSEYGGISYLSGLQLTPVMVHMLKPKHLEINISADDQKLREKEEFHTPKCKMIHVHAQLTNAHEMDLQDLVLSIRPYQEHREDIISKSPLVTWCGTLTKNIRKALGPVRLITSQFMTTERAIYQISRTGRTATHDAPWSFLLDLKWQSLLNSSFVYQILAEGQKDKKKVIKLSPGESFEHSCGLLFMFTGNYLVDVTCTVDKQRSPDVSRARAQAIIGQETTSPFPEFDTVDSGNIQVVVDGAVKTISTSAEFEEQKSKAQILHKPIADHWERNFAVLVK